MNIEEFSKTTQQWAEELAQAMIKTLEELNISPRDLELFNPSLYTPPLKLIY